MGLDVFDLKGSKVGEEAVPGVFSVDVNSHLVWEVVTGELANKRQGTHKAKEKGEVSGGGKKPFKQKGTGRARQGSIRAPQWKGGGTVFGPRPRSYAVAISPKKKKSGIKHIIAGKIRDNQVVVLDKLELGAVSTSKAFESVSSIVSASPFFAKYSENRKLRAKTNDNRRNVVIVVGEDNKEARSSFKNIPWVQLINVDRLAALPLYYNHGMIVTRDALKKMEGMF